MSARVTGPFDAKIIPQDDKLGDGISRMLLDKQYHGDLDGTSKGQMLAIGSAEIFRCLRRHRNFHRHPPRQNGQFFFNHTGIMTKAAPNLTISLVPDSGTGQLAGITGNMTINITPDGRHSYEFEYTLPDTH